jgi:hypothetical protein
MLLGLLTRLDCGELLLEGLRPVLGVDACAPLRLVLLVRQEMLAVLQKHAGRLLAGGCRLAFAFTLNRGLGSGQRLRLGLAALVGGGAVIDQFIVFVGFLADLCFDTRNHVCDLGRSVTIESKALDDCVSFRLCCHAFCFVTQVNSPTGFSVPVSLGLRKEKARGLFRITRAFSAGCRNRHLWPGAGQSR